ncbi:MAG: DegT/DnrJ/EryC1/StrS family aminotransferase [Thermodesulfobacteriota bacterium]
MLIPLVDLKVQYDLLKAEIDAAIQGVIDSGSFIGGRQVEGFENAFAGYCGAGHCVGVGNGTDALYLALRSLGIGHGDTVITVPNTFIATAEAISMTGAVPEFVDVDERTFTLDPEKLEELLERKRKRGDQRAKAVIPVHLYGQVCHMDAILGLARRYGLSVVEDAAQAHGSVYVRSLVQKPCGAIDGGLTDDCMEGRSTSMAGSLGDVGCFSFYPGKNLGAYGDGGAIVTSRPEIATKVRMLANHGRIAKYEHEFEGINSRLDSLQAAILKVKLGHLGEWTEMRRWNASRYRECLSDLDPERLLLPLEAPYGRHVYHLFVIQVPHRHEVMEGLKESGVATGVHYPVPLHLSPAYRRLGYREGDFPVAEKVAKEVLSLPIYPELSSDGLSYVCTHLRKILDRT